MAPVTIPDSRIKKMVQQLLDDSDSCLEVTSVRSRGSSLAHNICDRLGIEQRQHSHTVNKILLNKATSGQIAVYRGGKRIDRVDINAIKHANSVRKITVVVETPCASTNAPPVDLGSPAERAAKAHDLKLRDAYYAKLKLGGYWTKQSAFVRDAIIWYLLQLPKHTFEGGRLKREDIFRAANVEPTDQLLTSVSGRLPRLVKSGIIERRTKGKTTQYLRLCVELDTHTIKELRQQFAPESASSVASTPAEPEPVAVAEPEPESTVTPDASDSLESVLRRVLPEVLVELRDDLIQAVDTRIDTKLRAIAVAILSETGTPFQDPTTV